MKDKDYFGLGSGESALYKTLDNGRTWEVISQGGYGLGTYENGRIIFGSLEGKGLTYSDDGGDTRNESNITSGNWGCIIYDTEKSLVYACSFDNAGVVVSEDDGEIWEKTNITFGTFNSSWNNGRVTFGSNSGGVFLIGKTGYSYDLGNVVTSQGSFSTMEIPASIVPVINKIIAPQIFMEVTGQRFKNDVNDLDLLLPENNKFYISGDNYYSSNIDWEEDIGFKPFSVDISSLLEEDENLVISSEIKDTDTDTMKQTMRKVRSFIEARKNNAINNMSQKIKDCTVSSSNLREIDSTQDELLNAIQIEKMYENVLKESTVVVMTEIYNKIFSFNDALIRKLIYSGIYETILTVAGKINLQLKTIVKSGKSTVTSKDFNISYDFSKGLKIAFEKYLKSMSKNITVLNLNQDKDLISVAANNYKSNRIYYIQEANSIFTTLTASDDYLFEDSDKILNFLYEKTLENFHENLSINFKFPSLEDYSLKDRQAILKYCEAINEKFLERCFEYTAYVFENVLDKSLIKKNIEKILESGLEKADALKTIEAFFLKLFKSEWNLNKELI